MYFGITENLTTDCVSPYNNASLLSKVSEKIARENAENCRSGQPHCRLTPLPQGTSANIRINLIPRAGLSQSAAAADWLRPGSPVPTVHQSHPPHPSTSPPSLTLSSLSFYLPPFLPFRGGSRKKIFGGLAPHHLGGNNG